MGSVLSTLPSIYSFTSTQFSSYIKDALGKGAELAVSLYHEWFRFGTMLGPGAEFNNARRLLQAMTDLFETRLLESRLISSNPQLGKFLVSVAGGYEVESVMIPMQNGKTLCVSSQVGCRMGCSFCETGRMGLLRQLTAEEIVQQVMIAKQRYGFMLRNVVFMGMGEPFDNYDAVLEAVRILTDPHGIQLGARRITISTSGRVDGIARLMDENLPVNLAVSINAPNSRLRRTLMPLDRRFDLQALKEALLAYTVKTKQDVLIAYVLLKGVNDDLSYADELADYLQGLSVKINVIPYNPQSSPLYDAPEAEAMELFLKRLRERGYRALLRKTKGDSIMAACGQLGNPALKKKTLHVVS
ncbi:MAG: rlmn1 [Chlamydiales bacterium]|jgi:23S rRNA (adenine2503-C2)-methyltransferase|nr:rlmn1 [Chlamydiales bacterium]